MSAASTPQKRPDILMVAYTNYRRDPRVRREAQSLVELGYRVVFLSSRQPGEPVRETIDGVEVVKLPRFNDERVAMVKYMLDYVLFGVLVMTHILSRPRRYGLIHVNNMPDFLVFSAWLPRLMGTPVVHDVHDLMPELFQEKFRSAHQHWILRLIRFQERWAGRFASAVVTVEDRLRDILASRGVPRSKIHVLMNLPDDKVFSPRPVRKPRQIGDPFVLAYHGTLAYRLGLDIAIRAVSIARLTAPTIQLRIIGAGEELDRLVALSEELGLQNTVRFSNGFVPVQTIPGLLADVDAGIVPLRISGGTDIMLPTKLLEYVALGIPCIAPRTRTIGRYFDEKMVQFFQAENAESLAEAILALEQNPTYCDQLSSEAHRRFGAAYCWSHHKRRYTSLVEGLIAKRTADEVVEGG